MTARRARVSAAALALLVGLSSGVDAAHAETGDEGGGVDCAEAQAPARPQQVVAQREPSGEVRVTWEHDGVCVDEFLVELGLEKTASLGMQTVPVPATQRELVVPADMLAVLGAPLGSGRHFYAQVQAVAGGLPSPRTASAAVMAGQPLAAAEPAAAKVETAAYNLAFTPELSRTALARSRPRVAKQIVAAGAWVLALSESVQIRGASDTQLNPLMSKIRSAQRASGKSAAWRFTRTTRYARPGVLMGGDGTRILYNNKRVRLLSSCSDVTKVKRTVVKKVKRHGKVRKIKRKKTFRIPYSTSCTIKLPRVGAPIYQRWAPIVRFQDRKTGQRFWFVSAHLEVRKGAVFDENRSLQLKKILRTLDQLNTRAEPVIIAGDLNLSAARTPDLSTLNSRLTKSGFVDAVTATQAQNLAYGTYNGWKVQNPSKSGYASRLDHVYARGRVHFSAYATVLGTASDHNLIRATAWVK